MQALILAMIFAVLGCEYLSSIGLLPRILNYSPEILAMVATAVVVIVGVKNRFQFVRPAYWLVFGALALAATCGAVVNLLEAGPLFAGLRGYMRAIPFFFLPAVLAVGDRNVRTQMLLLLLLSAVQLPIAWDQRMSEIYLTGDSTFGTLMDSGVLTMFMICAACVLTGFYLRKRIRTGLYLLLLLLFLAPTMLNETKVVLLMLPIGLLTTFYAGSAAGTRLKNTVLGLIVLAGFLSIFVPVYDSFMKPRWGYGLLDFMTMEGRLEGYLVGGASVGDEAGKGRRFDGTFAAVAELSKDPATMFFGFGIGNASDSALGKQFDGEYYDLFSNLPITSFTYILLEYGILGVGLVLLLHWLIFLDSIRLARQSDGGIASIIAVGWTGVTAIFVIGLLYADIIPSNALSFLYWYFSGLIVAARMRSALTVAAPSRVLSNSTNLVAQRN